MVPARDAATIMLVRDGRGEDGPALEVCMVRRHLDSDFVGGAYVFPGGKVDVDDGSQRAQQVCVGRDDASASALLGVDRGGLAFWVAALRECFEEAGVLLAYPPGSAVGGPLLEPDANDRRRLARWRSKLNARSVSFVDMCEAEGLRLAVDRVLYFSHWITPEGAPKRYDTRFFVAAMAPGQEAIHDDHETVDTVWVRPSEALARAAAGEFDLIFPTMKNLEAIGRFATASDLLAAAAAADTVPAVLPRVVADGRGFRILLPGDDGYDAAPPPVGGGGSTLSATELGELVRRIGADGRGSPGPPAAGRGPGAAPGGSTIPDATSAAGAPSTPGATGAPGGDHRASGQP